MVYEGKKWFEKRLLRGGRRCSGRSVVEGAEGSSLGKSVVEGEILLRRYCFFSCEGVTKCAWRDVEKRI